MIPFVVVDEATIAPLHPFGICVALAFFAVDHVMMKLAVRRGFDRGDFRVLTIWLFVLGWGGAWLFDTLFYASASAPSSALQRFSSTGGIVGATIGGLVWTRVRIHKDDGTWRASLREVPVAILPVSEVVVGSWPVAFAIGRLGCALVHDHVGTTVAPGTLGSLFAVGFPRNPEDGIHHVLGPIHVVTGASDLRFDLGLLELMILTPLAIGFALSWKKNVAMGTYTIVASLVYGPLRFLLDSLRAADGPTGEPRHGGFTFAQYWSLAVIGIGLALLVRRTRTLPSDSDAPSAEQATSSGRTPARPRETEPPAASVGNVTQDVVGGSVSVTDDAQHG